MIQPIKHPLLRLKPWKRHSLVLMVAGIAYIFFGLSYVFTTPENARLAALEYAINWFPLTMWGWWFVVSGILTIVSSRWPPVSRTWGYTLLTGLAAAWSLFYFAGVLFGDSPTLNLSGGIIWGVFAFLWWAISGLVDPIAHHNGQV